MKRALPLLLLSILCLTSSASALGLQALFVDGLPVTLPASILSGGSYFVPVRTLADSLGMVVRWDERLRRAHLEGSGLQVFLSTTEAMTLNGEVYQMARSPFLRQGQLFVPLRSFVEALGGQVDYVEETEKIYVYTPNGMDRQVTSSSSELAATIFRDGTSLGMSVRSTSARVLNTLVVVSSSDGRMDFVGCEERHSGVPLTVLQPGVEYDALLSFPNWVNNLDCVEITWVDSTRFRGGKVQPGDGLLSFIVSFRPREVVASIRALD